MKILINKCLFSRDIPQYVRENRDIILFEGNLPKKVKINCRIKENMFSYFIFGSIQNIKESKKFYAMDYYYDDIQVTEYLPAITDLALNWKDSYFKLPSQLNHTDFGKFIKSNSGEKVLTGQILDKVLFQQILQNQCGLIGSDLLLLAPAREIKREYRFWVQFDNIITYSEYSWDENKKLEEVPEKVIKICERFLNYYTPHQFFTIDIAELDENHYKIIEYNSFSTSGFYNADMEKIIDVIKCMFG